MKLIIAHNPLLLIVHYDYKLIIALIAQILFLKSSSSLFSTCLRCFHIINKPPNWGKN